MKYNIEELLIWFIVNYLRKATQTEFLQLLLIIIFVEMANRSCLSRSEAY